MRQRVEIAKAFAYDGDLILMDEPFKSLDFELTKKLMNYIIDYWNSKNKLILFTTHNIDEALYLSNNIYIFRGPPLTLKDNIYIDGSKKNNDKDFINHYKKKMEEIIKS